MASIRSSLFDWGIVPPPAANLRERRRLHRPLRMGRFSAPGGADDDASSSSIRIIWHLHSTPVFPNRRTATTRAPSSVTPSSVLVRWKTAIKSKVRDLAQCQLKLTNSPSAWTPTWPQETLISLTPIWNLLPTAAPFSNASKCRKYPRKDLNYFKVKVRNSL